MRIRFSSFLLGVFRLPVGDAITGCDSLPDVRSFVLGSISIDASNIRLRFIFLFDFAGLEGSLASNSCLFWSIKEDCNDGDLFAMILCRQAVQGGQKTLNLVGASCLLASKGWSPERWR